MPFNEFLNHTADIYHLVKHIKHGQYGSASTEQWKYGDVPDIADIDCHFHTKNRNVNIFQGEPITEREIDTFVTVPYGTDVREQDKIIHKETNTQYTVMDVVPIRNHHIKVSLYRTFIQREVTP